MKISARFAASLLACVLAAGPLIASASTVTDCLGQISTLRLATQAAPFARDIQGDKLEAQLLFHLDKAFFELNRADLRDTLKQMDSYMTNLQRGVAAVKITAADAQPLQTGADGVVACINAIGQP